MIGLITMEESVNEWILLPMKCKLADVGVGVTPYRPIFFSTDL